MPTSGWAQVKSGTICTLGCVSPATHVHTSACRWCGLGLPGEAGRAHLGAINQAGMSLCEALEDRKHLSALLTPNWEVRLCPSKERGGQRLASGNTGQELNSWENLPVGGRPQRMLWLQTATGRSSGGEVGETGWPVLWALLVPPPQSWLAAGPGHEARPQSPVVVWGSLFC